MSATVNDSRIIVCLKNLFRRVRKCLKMNNRGIRLCTSFKLHHRKPTIIFMNFPNIYLCCTLREDWHVCVQCHGFAKIGCFFGPLTRELDFSEQAFLQKDADRYGGPKLNN